MFYRPLSPRMCELWPERVLFNGCQPTIRSYLTSAEDVISAHQRANFERIQKYCRASLWMLCQKKRRYLFLVPTILPLIPAKTKISCQYLVFIWKISRKTRLRRKRAPNTGNTKDTIWKNSPSNSDIIQSVSASVSCMSLIVFLPYRQVDI